MNTTLKRTLRGKSALAVVLTSLAVNGAVAAPHGQPAHAQMTREALDGSSRFRETVYGLEWNQLFFDWTFYAQAERNAGIQMLPRDAAGLVIAGCVLEDGVGGNGAVPGGFCNVPYFPGCDPPSFGEFSVWRCTNHFQDPTGAGVFGYLPAQTWGYDGPENGFTWIDGIAEYEQAVTASDSEERERAVERMLVALGCNVHLLQDQFSPAHVRNDAHPGHDIPAAAWLAGSSLLEVNGERYLHLGRNDFRAPSVAPRTFASHEAFFDSAIDWTNEHFFSDDTILNSYPRPGTGDLFATSEGVCPSALSVFNEEALHSNLVVSAPRLAMRRYSVREGLPLERLAGSACDSRGIDSIIHDNLMRLVPQATDYSAGLIDHFFRGELRLTQRSDGALEIRNTSHRPPGVDSSYARLRHGTAPQAAAEIVLLLEDEQGRRTEIWTEPLPPGGLVHEATIEIPDLDGKVAGVLSGKIVGCFRGGSIGDDPGIAAGIVEWIASPSLCRAGPYHVAHPVGDIDEDGGDDFLLAGLLDVGQYGLVGSLTLFSGETLEHQWFTETPLTGIGIAAAGVGDVDGDTWDDVFVVAFEQVQIRSGFDGTVLETAPLADLGDAFALGDVTSDGISDVLVVADPPTLYDGADGSALLAVGAAANFSDVRPASDWNGDGVREILISGSSTIQVVHTQTQDVLYASWDIKGAEYYGFREFLDVGDVTGDGFADFVGRDSDAGVAAFSGIDGTRLWYEAAGGGTLESAGDFSGDGSLDFVATSTTFTPDYKTILIVMRVFSSRNGLLLGEYVYEWGAGALPPRTLGDLNGDGHDDLGYFTFHSETGEQCLEIIYGE